MGQEIRSLVLTLIKKINFFGAQGSPGNKNLGPGAPPARRADPPTGRTLLRAANRRRCPTRPTAAAANGEGAPEAAALFPALHDEDRG